MLNIIETNLQPVLALSERGYTDMIVIHHTGCNDIDASAEQIDGWHKGSPNFWAMIGYHYVIRKNGTIERGRPEWAVGSHAYGENYHTLGIHLSGDFMTAHPTQAQIDICAALVAELCKKYQIPIDRDHIVGHCDLMSTSCPGDNLYCRLNEIITLAKGGTTAQSTAQKQNISDERVIWDFLKGKGLNDYAAAGVMGNLYAESGLQSTNLENYYERQLGMSDEEYTKAVDYGTYGNFVNDKAGYGLAQWTYYTRKQNLLTYAKAKGTSIGDLNMQLEFLWEELQGYTNLMKKLKNADSVFEASNAMLLDFERPADQSAAVQKKRAAFGQEFYEDFAGLDIVNGNEGVVEMRYNTLDDMPEWALPTIQKMINKGYLGGSGAKDADGNPIELDLSLDMIRVFVINDRAGLYN